MSFVTLLQSLFQAIHAWLVNRQQDVLKKAGKDEAENEAKDELLERIKVSNDIDDSELPDSLLKHPDDR